MKRKTIILMSLVLILALGLTAVATGSQQQITVNANLMKVVVNGETLTADNFLYNGTTYIPIRAAAEAMGADVEFLPESMTAEIWGEASADALSKVVKPLVVYSDIYKRLGDVLRDLQYINSQANYIYNNLITKVYGGASFIDMSSMIKEQTDSFASIQDRISTLRDTVDSILSDYPNETLLANADSALTVMQNMLNGYVSVYRQLSTINRTGSMDGNTFINDIMTLQNYGSMARTDIDNGYLDSTEMLFQLVS